MAKKGFALTGKILGSFNPANATAHYIYENRTNTSNQARIQVPRAGTIKKVTVNFLNNGTLASAEISSVYLNKNGASNETLLGSSVVNNIKNYILKTLGLSIPVSAGEYVNIQRTTPTRLTLPTAVYISVSIWIE